MPGPESTDPQILEASCTATISISKSYLGMVVGCVPLFRFDGQNLQIVLALVVWDPGRDIAPFQPTCRHMLPRMLVRVWDNLWLAPANSQPGPRHPQPGLWGPLSGCQSGPRLLRDRDPDSPAGGLGPGWLLPMSRTGCSGLVGTHFFVSGCQSENIPPGPTPSQGNMQHMTQFGLTNVGARHPTF